MDEVNDARILAVAAERMAHYDPAALVSQEDVDREFGFTDDDLADVEVDIE
ncbi:MAG: hypothetical protein LIO52_04235 [Oscillospiraceae bacterium]|nr:hypothetical protein [Oscillospiraceae bacterium]